MSTTGKTTGKTTDPAAAAAKRLGPLQWVLLVVSGLLMASGVGLGIAGTLEDPKAAEQIRQMQQEAAAQGLGAQDSEPQAGDMASGFVGGGGDVRWPFPVPGLPGGQPESVPESGQGGGQPAAVEPEPAPVADPWSPAIFRMGFGFFVGFAMAYALRSFVKVTIVSAGVFFLLLFGLQYAGLVEVKWAAMADRYDSLQEWLLAQVGGFQAFVTGYLPSAGAALAGLGLGFMRK